MQTHEFRNLSTEELTNQVKALEADYYSIREDARTGKEKNHAQLRFLRRNIARAHTILNENEAKQVSQANTKQKLPKK